MQPGLDILIDELVTDEELRYSFLRSPRTTLRLADDWRLPLSETEMRVLTVADPSLWERVADAVDARVRAVY